MRVFNQSKTKELNLEELDLNKGRLFSDRIRSKGADGNIVTEHILVFHSSVDVNLASELKALRALLQSSDYKAIKYAEGVISAEEFAPVKANRQRWRLRINEIEEQLKQREP